MALSFDVPAWEVATPIESSFNLPSDMKSSVARDQLQALRFDQAPVMRGSRLMGWVRTSHLVSRGFVETRTKLLDECTVLARNTPVSDVIHFVAVEHLVFLAGPSGIREFVVASDLDRHAIRCYLYVLISELEMRLADCVDRSAVSDAEVRSLFQSRDRKRFDAAAASGMEMRPVEYLVFSAYAKLVPRIPGLANLGTENYDDVATALTELNRLRNCVAHPSKALTSEFDPKELSELTKRAERLVQVLEGRPTR